MEIKIIKMPPGEAPLWVREAWVDLKLPTTEERIPFAETVGVVTGDIVEDNKGYRVDTFKAIEILKQKNPEAAQWWVDNFLPKLDLFPGQNPTLLAISQLVFNKDVCKIVEG